MSAILCRVPCRRHFAACFDGIDLYRAYWTVVVLEIDIDISVTGVFIIAVLQLSIVYFAAVTKYS